MDNEPCKKDNVCGSTSAESTERERSDRIQETLRGGLFECGRFAPVL